MEQMITSERSKDLPSAIAAAVMGLEWARRGPLLGVGLDEDEADRRHASVQLAVQAALAASPPLPAGAAGGDRPCQWGGGNDVIWCSTCGEEYAYAKGEQRPPCPRLTLTGPLQKQRPGQTAGAAGGGSGDLAKLSAAARGIYLASKTVHAPRWRSMREHGLPIISTWIDEAGKGETACFTDLWRRCVSEAAGARAVIVYREQDEVLKGAFVEVGAALAAGVPVFAVGCDEFSFVNHAGVTRCATVEHALNCALGLPPASSNPPPAEDLAGQGEPVAWAYEYRENGQWRDIVIKTDPRSVLNRDYVRNIRPLYAAPAPSRPADREEIARAIMRSRGTPDDLIEAHERRGSMGWRDAVRDADAVLSILALRDAPRNGGDEWRPVATSDEKAREVMLACLRAFRMSVAQDNAMPFGAFCELVDDRMSKAAVAILSAPAPSPPAHQSYTLVEDEGGTFLQAEAGQLFICADINTVRRVLTALGAPPSLNAGDGTQPSGEKGGGR